MIREVRRFFVAVGITMLGLTLAEYSYEIAALLLDGPPEPPAPESTLPGPPAPAYVDTRWLVDEHLGDCRDAMTRGVPCGGFCACSCHRVPHCHCGRIGGHDYTPECEPAS